MGFTVRVWRMRSSLAQFFLLLLPGLIAALLFGWFDSLVQADHLGGGIAQLFIIAGLATGFVFWIVGVLLAVPLRRQAGSLINFAAFVGGVSFVGGATALAIQWINPAIDPSESLSFNWPYLAWLGVYSGALTLAGTAVLRVRN